MVSTYFTPTNILHALLRSLCRLAQPNICKSSPASVFMLAQWALRSLYYLYDVQTYDVRMIVAVQSFLGNLRHTKQFDLVHCHVWGHNICYS